MLTKKWLYKAGDINAFYNYSYLRIKFFDLYKARYKNFINKKKINQYKGWIVNV